MENWNEFKKAVEHLNGSMVNGEIFWVYDDETYSVGAEVFRVKKFDISDGKYILIGNRLSFEDKQAVMVESMVAGKI